MTVAREPPFAAGRPVTQPALAWAASLHRGQRRDVDHAPFILHPLEVAALLAGRDYDDEVVAAGLLHDAIEDTDARLDDIRERFGARVARIVAAVSEDPTIPSYQARKAALSDQVAAADPDAHAVYAADKIVKARELRAQAAHTGAALDDPQLRQRLQHYEHSLRTLQTIAPQLPLTHQLEFEIWALRRLPPRPGAN